MAIEKSSVLRGEISPAHVELAAIVTANRIQTPPSPFVRMIPRQNVRPTMNPVTVPPTDLRLRSPRPMTLMVWRPYRLPPIWLQRP